MDLNFHHITRLLKLPYSRHKRPPICGLLCCIISYHCLEGTCFMEFSPYMQKLKPSVSVCPSLNCKTKVKPMPSGSSKRRRNDKVLSAKGWHRGCSRTKGLTLAAGGGKPCIMPRWGRKVWGVDVVAHYEKEAYELAKSKGQDKFTLF